MPEPRNCHALQNLQREEIKRRLHAVKVRTQLVKRLPTILADQLDYRLTGFSTSHASWSGACSDWRKRLRAARLLQCTSAIQKIEYEYLETLVTQGLEEFWYKESDAGCSIIMNHYDGLSDALKQTEDCS